MTLPVPQFAQILFVAWKSKRPTCTIQNQSVGDPVDSVVLLFSKPPSDITSWYREKLDGLGFTEYTIEEGLHEKCTGKEPVENPITVFSKIQVSEFCWNRDMLKRPTIVIKKANSVYKSHGYKTTVELLQSAI